ncbi:MAG: ABC transporter permease [Propionibacteriaceae bacterium]|nr:ABC transporter permease [Propionibacteriaceae bacterium]
MNRRNQWAIIARHEIVTKLTDRTFIASTLVTLALLIAGMVFMVIRGASPPQVSVAVVGPQAKAVVQRVNATNQTPWKIVDVSTPEAARTGVADGDYDIALLRWPGRWEAIVEETDSFSGRWIALIDQAITLTSMIDAASAHGVEPASLLHRDPLKLVNTSETNGTGWLVAFIIGIMFAVTFFTTALIFGLQIAASVVKEKESRVVEILSAAVPPAQLLLGKILGNSALALAQVALYLGTIAIGGSFTSYAALLPTFLASGGWFLAFFVTGFLALSCLWAASGAMATRYEDIQQTSLPLNLVLMAGYVAAFVAPAGLKTVLSFIPILSSVLMPMRLVAGSAAWWEALLALAANLVFTVFAVWAGGRLYLRGLLHTGGTLKWGQAFAR